MKGSLSGGLAPQAVAAVLGSLGCGHKSQDSGNFVQPSGPKPLGCTVLL
jgi:hypothetical protein